MLRSLACALVGSAAAAQAQRTPAYQDGQVAAGDALKAIIQGRDSRAGDALGRGVHPTGITGSNAFGLCLDSAVTGGTYGCRAFPTKSATGSPVSTATSGWGARSRSRSSTASNTRWGATLRSRVRTRPCPTTRR